MASIPGPRRPPADPEGGPLWLPSSTPPEEFNRSPGAGRPRLLRLADEPIEVIDPDVQRLLDEATKREERALKEMNALIREMEQERLEARARADRRRERIFLHSPEPARPVEQVVRFKTASFTTHSPRSPARAEAGIVLIPGPSTSSAGDNDWDSDAEMTEEQPRVLLRHEQLPGRPTLLVVKKVPLPQEGPLAGILRRPHAAVPDRSLGAIPKRSYGPSLPARQIATASTGGTRRSSEERGRSLNRAPFPPSAAAGPAAAATTAATAAARASRAVSREEPPRRRRPSPVETCRQHYTRLLRSRREISAEHQVPHRGPITRPSGGRFPIKMCGVRFGNLTSIPSHHELDPPTYTCFNCRRRCRGNGHKVMDCEETYLVH